MDPRNWYVDDHRCRTIGETLKKAKPPAISHPLIDHQREHVVWAEIVFISICHQTNWHRLHNHIMELVVDQSGILSPESLADLTETQVREILGNGLNVSDDNDIAERRRLLNQLGESVKNSRFFSELSERIQQPLILGGKNGFYRLLDTLTPYREDPLRKKSRILVHQLLRSQLIDVWDKDLLAPAVDYHLIRLYVRSGRVYSPASNIDQFPDNLLALRHAVETAMRITAESAELRIDEINHLEWQLGRSYCVRERARCAGDVLSTKPVDLPLAALAQQQASCPIANNCLGKTHSEYRKFVEPQSPDSFY